MAKILISIVSDQTLPNYIFIKEFKSQVARFVFISSEKMEKNNKSKVVYQTANIKDKKVNVLTVKEDKFFTIEQELNNIHFAETDEIFVNLTGGTKIMSIAVWQYFKKFKNATFYYIPIGKNTFEQVFEDKTTISHKFTKQLNVEEYLKIYGIRYEKQKIIFSEQQCEDVFNDVKSTNYDLDRFPKNKLKKFDLLYQNKQIYTKWFEEFLYYRIKNILKLNDKQIVTGIKLFEVKEEEKKEYYNNDNEIDIFFLHNNNPYLIEAKFSVGKDKINTKALNDYIFKLAAVNKRFGLRARATIMTLGDFDTRSEDFKDNLYRRCKITNIHVPFDRNQIIDEQTFTDKIFNFIK